MYFIIRELLGILKSVAKDAHLNNHSKTTNYTQNHFLNCIVVCLLYYSFKFSQQSLMAALDFRLLKYWLCPLFKWQDAYFLGAVRPNMVFFSCRMPEKLTRKAGVKVYRWSLCSIFHSEKKPTFETVWSHLQALFNLYSLYKGCFCNFNGLLMWVGETK